MSPDVEVHVDLDGRLQRVGTLHRHPRRGGEATSFEYHPDWLADPSRFSLEPALTLGDGAFAPGSGRAMFGSIGDSAPDTWGRRLMQRAERSQARAEGRAVRTLSEIDYLLGVTDLSRMGALRFRSSGDREFQAPAPRGVPALVELGRLLSACDRVAREEETDEDLRLIFAPGSSLGGARPKASVMDARGMLSIAKFPKPDDDWSIETWEAVALRLASRAGIRTPDHELIDVGGQRVLLSRRFDREPGRRIPFLSALSMLGRRDGERGSYPELVDAVGEHGAQARADALELYRRVVFNVLISNVDDHLRNHGFLWEGGHGWRLSPVYDLNPTPVDVRARILSTNIDLDDGTCDLDLVISAAELFGVAEADALRITRGIATATSSWREIATTLGARPAEIARMASAFEHRDAERARALEAR